jgi:hypothetical protein
MSDYAIGSWVRRRGRRSKWHVVESDVADRAVVRCGKQLRHVTPSGGELQVSALMPLTRLIGQPQLCKAGCEAREVAPTETDLSRIEWRPEDDASTHPDDTP